MSAETDGYGIPVLDPRQPLSSTSPALPRRAWLARWASAALAAAAFMLAAAAAFAQDLGAAGEVAAVPDGPPPNNGGCFSCHNRMEFDPAAFNASVHAENACGDCHKQFHGDPHGQGEVAAPTLPWLAAVLAVEPYSNSAWAACGDCHEEVVDAMAQSRHIAPMVEDGTGEGAFCGDCHGDPHYVTGAPHSPRENFAFVNQTCVNCHSDPELVARHDLNPDVVYTYETSIHGRVARLDPDNAPTCVDCHEAHAVMGADQPGSPVALENRAGVCASCHEGANENFASVITHSRISADGDPVAYWATVFFASLTVGVIVLLVIHMIMDMAAGIRESLRRRL